MGRLGLIFSAFLLLPGFARAQCATGTAPLPASAADGIRMPMALSPVLVSPTADRVYPVKGSDGRVHIAYSVVLTNVTGAAATVSRIAVVDPAEPDVAFGQDTAVTTAGEPAVGKVLVFGAAQPSGGIVWTRELPAGGSGAVFFDVTLPPGAAIPTRLEHRVEGRATLLGPDAPFGYSGSPVAVACESPIVLGAPLRGTGWLDGGGCCAVLTAHRTALNPVNGRLRPAEQFAIDFVRLDAQGRAFSGDRADVKNWPYYGADIVAAGAGTVVEVVRDMPDAVPGASPPLATLDSAAGNHVIVDMGQGRYAMYAHLAPGSTAVRVGDRVEKGQRLGALGNSGNSDAPHLHFQVMDRPSPLDAVGLPFVIDRMRVAGQVTGSEETMADLFIAGKPLRLDQSAARDASGTLPLEMNVLDFP